MSDTEWDDDTQYNYTEKKSPGEQSEYSESESGESEMSETLHHYEGDITAVISLMKVDKQKTLSEKSHCNVENAPVAKTCLSKYYVGKEIARGSQAVILEGCLNEASSVGNTCPYIIRIAALTDFNNRSPNPSDHAAGQQYLNDIKTRRYLSCHCPRLNILALQDAFICQKSATEIYGVAVAARMRGNLLDYLFTLPKPTTAVKQLSEHLTEIIDQMHTPCFVVHRDISYQNILYNLSEDGKNVELYITDFESAYIEPVEKRSKTSQIYDGYKYQDKFSVEKTIHELEILAEMLEAKAAKNDKQVQDLWRQLSSFVKSDLIKRDRAWLDLDKINMMSKSMENLSMPEPNEEKKGERSESEIEDLIT